MLTNPEIFISALGISAVMIAIVISALLIKSLRPKHICRNCVYGVPRNHGHITWCKRRGHRVHSCESCKMFKHSKQA